MARNAFVLLFLVLLFLSSSHARILAPKQGGKEIRVNSGAGYESTVTEEGFFSLMGSEECNEEEEECLKRRMMADAHLDYIYTQRHKKP